MSPTKGTISKGSFIYQKICVNFQGEKSPFPFSPLARQHPPGVASLVLLLGGNAPRARLGEELPNATPWSFAHQTFRRRILVRRRATHLFGRYWKRPSLLSLDIKTNRGRQKLKDKSPVSIIDTVYACLRDEFLSRKGFWNECSKFWRRTVYRCSLFWWTMITIAIQR